MKNNSKLPVIPINNFFQYYILTYPYNILYKPNINENNIYKKNYNKLLHELNCYFLLYSKESLSKYIFPYKYNFKIIELLHNHNYKLKINNLLDIYKNNPLNFIFLKEKTFNIKLYNLLKLNALNKSNINQQSSLINISNNNSRCSTPDLSLYSISINSTPNISRCNTPDILNCNTLNNSPDILNCNTLNNSLDILNCNTLNNRPNISRSSSHSISSDTTSFSIISDNTSISILSNNTIHSWIIIKK
jgi:hypothetical protein